MLGSINPYKKKKKLTRITNLYTFIYIQNFRASGNVLGVKISR